MSKRICVTVDAHGVFTGIKVTGGCPFDQDYFVRTERKDAPPEVSKVREECIGNDVMDELLHVAAHGITAEELYDRISVMDHDREVLVGALDSFGHVRYYPVVDVQDGPNHRFVILTLDQHLHIDLTEDDLR